MKQSRTFREIYETEKQQKVITASQLFLMKVARKTMRSEWTVRQWLSGKQKPDRLAREMIAQLYDVDPDGLFPEADNKKKV